MLRNTDSDAQHEKALINADAHCDAVRLSPTTGSEPHNEIQHTIADTRFTNSNKYITTRSKTRGTPQLRMRTSHVKPNDKHTLKMT